MCRIDIFSFNFRERHHIFALRKMIGEAVDDLAQGLLSVVQLGVRRNTAHAVAVEVIVAAEAVRILDLVLVLKMFSDLFMLQTHI